MNEQMKLEAAAPLPQVPENPSRRWLALVVLCLSVLMIMLDSTIVNVALPSIKTALSFSGASLAWVVNAYFLFFGGFLLLGGRLGDLFGHRKIFVVGVGTFTLASFVCGVAQSPILLIAARALQGLGGAIVTAMALSLIMCLFTDPKERAKAMGVYGFVCASGSSIGALLGGLLTSGLGWRWIFLINLPVGLVVIALSLRLLARDRRGLTSANLDIVGALSGTAALMLAVFAIVNGNAWGWLSNQTLACSALAALFLAAFLLAESRVATPLMPLRLFKIRNVTVGNIVVTFWAAALFSWFFLSSLCLQLVSGYEPIEVGFAFLPASLIMGLISLGVSSWLVNAIGLRWPLAAGLILASIGLLLLSNVPAEAKFAPDVLPGMLLFGLGAGLAVNPMLLAATNGVPEDQTGLASGVVNTFFAIGGAFGLAALSSYAAHHTEAMEMAGEEPLAALNKGYQAALLGAACCSALAAVLSATSLRTGRTAIGGG